MKTSINRSEQFESKAHGAQRTRHTKWVGEERAPRNAAIESRSRLLEVSKLITPSKYVTPAPSPTG